MSASSSPPGTTAEVRARSALVLAPHYDDEVLGCGGLVAKLAAAGAAVRVLFLSDSGADAPPGEDRKVYSHRRRLEAGEATEILGVAGADHLELPDGGLDQHLGALAAGIRRAVLSGRPQLLLVPSPLEASRDHRAAFRALHELLIVLRQDDPLWPLVQTLEILAYEVNRPLDPDLLVDVGAQIETVEKAMACYASQQERHDYAAARLGLSRFRTHTLPPGVEAAEAFRRLGFADFQTRSPARLIAELGGAPEIHAVEEGPRISVIVRTRDRPRLLAEALASLAANSYRRVSVVVVNDGGAPPPLPADFPLPLEVVHLETNRGRAAAANAGLATARGDFVTFLDDDDLADPEHLATLAGLVRAAGVRVAYTDAAVGVYELDPEAGWRCVERRLPYSRDFDPELLRFDNYIPFNTLILDKRLCDEAGELDEGLPFFEDWDYLIRLAALTPFHHLARVTCEYRHFRGGHDHILGGRPRQRADFLTMKARVIEKHAGASSAAAVAHAVAHAVDRLRADGVRESEEAARLRRELEAVRCDLQDRHHELAESVESYHLLNGQLASLQAYQTVLETSERRSREELRQREVEVVELSHQTRILSEQLQARSEQVEALTGQIGEQTATLAQTWEEIERLGERIRAMESSKAWRVHQWWQRHKP